jgi:hypothetical protein
MTTEKALNNYICISCDYHTSHKRDFNKHLSTAKHKNTTIDNQKIPTTKAYHCGCGNVYKHRGSLHNHARKCPNLSPQEKFLDQNVIIEMLKQNTEFKDMLMVQQKTINEMVPKIGNNNNNTNNTNNTNVIVLLNEKCKDALNMSEFLKTLEITLADLKYYKG